MFNWKDDVFKGLMKHKARIYTINELITQTHLIQRPMMMMCPNIEEALTMARYFHNCLESFPGSPIEKLKIVQLVSFSSPNVTLDNFDGSEGELVFSPSDVSKWK